MSLTLHITRQNRELPAASARTDRALAPAILAFARKALSKSARLIANGTQAVAEARMQRALIEAELYRNRYRHTSKNDDDLPIVELPAVKSAPAERPASIALPRVALRRAAGAVAAAAKRVLPAVLVLSFFAAALAAIFAIRLAIWLPLYWH